MITEEEALKIIKIMATADNWCSQCGPSLIEDFTTCFPQFKVLADEFNLIEFRNRVRTVEYANIDKDIWDTNVWEID